MKWDDYKEKKMGDPKFKQAYEELEAEYFIIDEILKSEEQSRMTQNKLSEKIGIVKSDIIGLESGKAKPSISLISKYNKF